MTQARTALVTGTSSGIGQAIADRLARDGWAVTGLDRAEAGTDSLVHAEQIDLTDGDAVERLANRLETPVALVHAAGFMRTGTFGRLDRTAGDAMHAVHVRALAILADRLVPRMTPGGRIVAIGSRTSGGAAGKAQYAASKAALGGLIRSLAAEVVGRGITANIVSPAATDTPLLDDPARAGVQPVLPPIGRFIQPDEIAAAVSFLLSEDASAITGQDLLICGGASL